MVGTCSQLHSQRSRAPPQAVQDTRTCFVLEKINPVTGLKTEQGERCTGTMKPPIRSHIHSSVGTFSLSARETTPRFS